MSQIKNKFIEGASGATQTGVTDDKIRLRSNNYLRSRNAANSADVNIVKVNASDVIEFPSVPQISSGTPSADADVATIAAVKLLVSGARDPKDACRAVATTSISLPPGGTSLTVDGLTMANGDRLLLAGQGTASQNGIYVVSGVGSSVVLTRSTDADTSAEVTYGMSCLIVEGTANAGATYMLTTPDPITLGTTSLTFVKISSGGTTYTGGDMITVTGSVISADLSATGGLASTNAGNAAGQMKVNVDSVTTKIDGSNQVASTKPQIDVFTLNSTDITNQYVDLSQVAENAMSIKLTPNGGPEQKNGTDYTINLTGGTGSKTRITFAGDLATLGAAALVAGDVVIVEYRYL